ncbi:GNAT family N-acetyltransferase [Bdellovibrio sp. 22V]|uniref:GNAT family N-acetyltransferase n=1 Tax=Bdellovibrio TaxID=958 RepID=UPI002542A6B3|nr:GNAT family N-acetyltransferase [Bdellovibrio sp. 22V]WII71633.1 GNAT family N-acetyltransferase [Bdellovibrio sp. 22V]
MRRANALDVSSLRLLLNISYKELADQGWNFTGSYQDEAVTLKQVLERRVFVLCDEDELIGTVSVRDENWFTNRKSLYVGKLAILPRLKRQGLGGLLMNFAENLAKNEGYESLQLDTAKSAVHLIKWYQELGFQIVGGTQHQGKTYESLVFEKCFS